MEQYCKNCGQFVREPNSDLCERCNESESYQWEETPRRKGGRVNEDNGEDFVMAMAKIALILSIILVIVYSIIVVAIGAWPFLVCGIIVILDVYLLYCFIKLFVNISRKASAIYELLRDRL